MAVQFNGATDSLSLTGLNLANITVCLWHRNDNLAEYPIMLSLRGSSYCGLYCEIYGADNFSVTYGTDDYGTTITTNVWYHMAARLSGGNTLTGFLNGVQDCQAGGSANADRIVIGPDPLSTYYIRGRYAYMKAWAAALTPGEIQLEMAQARPHRTANIIGFWPMFPGSDAERARDYSGQGNHLTAGGTLVDVDTPPVGWGTSRSGLLLPSGGEAPSTHDATGTAALSALAASATGTVVNPATHQMEGYQFFDDDDDKDNSTAAQNQDTDHTVAVNDTTRVRFLVEGPTNSAYQVEYAEDGTSDWHVLEAES